MKPEEIVMSRRQSSALVDADSTLVNFTRWLLTADGSGGRSKSSITLPLQRVVIYPQRHRADSSMTTWTKGQPGEQRPVGMTWFMMGGRDLDVQRRDQLVHDDQIWEVEYVEDDRRVHTLCQIVKLGLTDRQTT